MKMNEQIFTEEDLLFVMYMAHKEGMYFGKDELKKVMAEQLRIRLKLTDKYASKVEEGNIDEKFSTRKISCIDLKLLYETKKHQHKNGAKENNLNKVEKK